MNYIFSQIPLSHPPPDPPSNTPTPTPLPKGAIIGGTLGGAAFLVSAVAGFIYFYRRKRNNKNKADGLNEIPAPDDRHVGKPELEASHRPNTGIAHPLGSPQSPINPNGDMDGPSSEPPETGTGPDIISAVPAVSLREASLGLSSPVERRRAGSV